MTEGFDLEELIALAKQVNDWEYCRVGSHWLPTDYDSNTGLSIDSEFPTYGYKGNICGISLVLEASFGVVSMYSFPQGFPDVPLSPSYCDDEQNREINELYSRLKRALGTPLPETQIVEYPTDEQLNEKIEKARQFLKEVG